MTLVRAEQCVPVREVIRGVLFVVMLCVPTVASGQPFERGAVDSLDPTAAEEVAVVVPEGAGRDRVLQLLGPALLRAQFSWEDIVAGNPEIADGIHPGTTVRIRAPSREMIAALHAEIERLEGDVEQSAADIARLDMDLVARNVERDRERDRADRAEHALVNWKVSSVVLPILALLIGAGALFLRFRTVAQSDRRNRNAVEELTEKLAEVRGKRDELRARLQRLVYDFSRQVPDADRRRRLMELVTRYESGPIEVVPPEDLDAARRRAAERNAS